MIVATWQGRTSSFYHYGVLFETGAAQSTYLPWFAIESFSFDGSADFQRRITATRLVGLGVFALAAPKAMVAGLTFMTFSTTDGSDYVAEISRTPQEMHQLAKVAFNEWARWRPDAVRRPVEVASEQRSPDPLDQLKSLAELHAAGAITDEEFAAKKRDLLDRI